MYVVWQNRLPVRVLKEEKYPTMPNDRSTFERELREENLTTIPNFLVSKWAFLSHFMQETM